MKKSVIASTLIILLALLSACSSQPSEGTGVAIKNGYRYQGELANGTYNGYGVLTYNDSIIYSGQWRNGKRHGYGTTTDSLGRTVKAKWRSDSIVKGTVSYCDGTYTGEFNAGYSPDGHGIYTGRDGSYYDGAWSKGKRNGFGCGIDATGKTKVGEWKDDKYRGERMTYTAERIYGIDISRYQHGKGKKKYSINWSKLRITNLGSISRKKVSGKVDYPVSFIYIKSTEGASVRNPYYLADYRQARSHGIPCGAYHFFSPTSPASKQANYFLKYSKFSKGDFPPVLDVEPTHAQIKKMGGADAMFSRIRTWLNIVEKRTGIRPILYVSQQFVNKYLPSAPDIMKNYQVWIARYGEYKPEVRLVFWQLCPDGRVQGIHGEVDINVFNGYHDSFRQFLETNRIK